MEPSMEKAKAYDLPTRLFHLLFAGLFVAAYALAKLMDDESPWFSQHMLLGLILFFVTITRIVWGLIGSKYARFSSFPLKPGELLNYFKEILSSSGKRYFGHNPASAWAALTMIGLALGLGITGYLMSSGQKETYEDLHELLANAFVFVVIAHVAGVLLHNLRHQDGIVWSMVSGKKAQTGDVVGVVRPHRFAAVIMAGMIGAFAFQIYKNYDPTQSTTRLFGQTLQLGENEGGEHEETKEEHEEDDD